MFHSFSNALFVFGCYSCSRISLLHGNGEDILLCITSMCSFEKKNDSQLRCCYTPTFYKSTNTIPVYVKSRFRSVRNNLKAYQKEQLTYSMPCDACTVVNFQLLPSQYFKSMYSFGHLNCAFMYMWRGFKMICLTSQTT